MLKNIKLAPKLIFMGGMLVLIPLLVIGFFSVTKTGSSLREASNQQLAVQSAAIAKLVDSILEMEKKIVLEISVNPRNIRAAQKIHTEGSEASQSEIAELNEHFTSITKTKDLGEKIQLLGYVNTKGVVSAASAKKFIGVSLTDRRYFQTALNGNINIGEAALNKVTGKPFVSIAAPVFTSDRTIVGVMIYILDISFLNDMISKEKVGQNGYAFIIDKSGLTIAHPDSKRVMKDNIYKVKGLETFTDKMKSGVPGVVSYSFQGVAKTAGYAPIENTGWGVGITLSDEEFMAPIILLRNWTIGLCVVSIIAVFVIFSFFSMSIAKNIKKGVHFASQIAKGNLEATIDIDQNDEIGILAKGLKSMADELKEAIYNINQVMGAIKAGDLSQNVTANLSGDFSTLKESINGSIDMLSRTIVQVVTNSNQVNIGSQELASSAQALASGTTEQAASLEEISSSMNEVDSKTKANDENTSQAKQLINKSQEVVDGGNQQMSTLLQSINEIKDTSYNVAKIIKDIDEIAFQTNLLALNAAVEAARAGKYGKGFAVVAEEVRNLAARSAEAAKNTADLINSSVSEVEKGVEKADKTAEALNAISESTAKVNDIIEEISASSAEQRNGIREINEGLVQVNQVIQNNSSISEETASASEELAQQAVNMQNLMSEFKLSKNDTQIEINPEMDDLSFLSTSKMNQHLLQ